MPISVPIDPLALAVAAKREVAKREVALALGTDGVTRLLATTNVRVAAAAAGAAAAPTPSTADRLANGGRRSLGFWLRGFFFFCTFII